ncbi:MAG: hypothetical protein JXR96_28585 [Deltaproteobacteria bacterium]|nr:hypothetical protein [Deltaproteobacteria bacterium]
MSAERDLPTDARRLRIGLLLAACALLTVMVLAAVRALRPGFVEIQARFAGQVGEAAAGVRQVQSCRGELDRCTTCHLGVEREDLRAAGLPPPFGPHPERLGHHQRAHVEIGCSACHGGVGRALNSDDAHVNAATGERDPLMREPHIQAACARCHLPGEVPGTERLLHGARLYAELGCAVCHPLGREGLGGADYGPDLRTIGRKSLGYLRDSLIDPSANFAGSTMPAFDRSFEDHPEALADLLVYLESLPLEPAPGCRLRERNAGLLAAPCASCHAGTAGNAAGRFRHGCVWIRERRDALRCGRCHPGTVPDPGPDKGFCPRIQQERKACSACHDAAR